MVEGRWVVQTILIEDQCPGHGAELGEAMPVPARLERATYGIEVRTVRRVGAHIFGPGRRTRRRPGPPGGQTAATD